MFKRFKTFLTIGVRGRSVERSPPIGSGWAGHFVSLVLGETRRTAPELAAASSPSLYKFGSFPSLGAAAHGRLVCAGPVRSASHWNASAFSGGALGCAPAACAPRPGPRRAGWARVRLLSSRRTRPIMGASRFATSVPVIRVASGSRLGRRLCASQVGAPAARSAGFFLPSDRWIVRDARGGGAAFPRLPSLPAVLAFGDPHAVGVRPHPVVRSFVL